jgi:DNA-binding NarL/FixJ family response regulator
MDVDNRVAYLTARERDVLALLSQGRSDLGIGSALFVTQKTVEFHTRNIFRKLELPADRSLNRRVLAALAFLQADAVSRLATAALDGVSEVSSDT